MKRNLILTLCLTLLSALGAWAADLNRYEVRVIDFSELKVTDGINVDYRCSADSAGYAVFSCRPEVVSAIILSTSPKRLNVQLDTDRKDLGNLPTVTVYSRYLGKVTNSGDSTVRVISPAGCPKFEARLEGNGRLAVRGIDATEVKATALFGHGTLTLSGKCAKASFHSGGSMITQGDLLEAADVSIKVMGTGEMGVWATKKLSVFGTGSTTIYYRGTPEIKNTSLGIKLQPLP